MYECDICLSKIKNKYIVKKDDFDELKNTLHSYCDEYEKKFNKFTVMIIWIKNDMIINEISVPYTNTLQRTDFFQPDSLNYQYM